MLRKYEQTRVKQMKKRFFILLILLLSILILSGCVFTTNGESLEAFSQRMNNINKNYNMTSEGYIVDTENREFTKFFRFSENELMLNFKYDKKNRLNEMNIVFEPKILTEAPLSFIKDCIKCFVQNDETEKKILTDSDFENAIKKINMKTICAESDNIKMEIDTTELGTVISIYRAI